VADQISFMKLLIHDNEGYHENKSTNSSSIHTKF